MSTIPVSSTQEQFEQYIRPGLSVAKRGCEFSIPLYMVFNYILYRLHTGCQWERLPITDANGFILATTGIVAGNHNDAFELKDNLRTAFKFIKRLGLSIIGSYFNADAAFDTQAARWTCF